MTDVVSGNEAASAVTATIGTGTKTSLGDKENGIYKILWTKGDRISIYSDGAPEDAAFFTEEDGKTTAVFSAEEGAGTLDFTKGAIAAYPAERAEISGLDEIRIDIPKVQYYQEDSFGEEAMPMVSDVTESPDFTFHNAAGVLNLQLRTTLGDFTVKSITISTSDGFLSGQCRYNPETRRYVTDNGGNYSNKVILDCGKGVNIGIKETSFMIVVPHQEYQDLAICVSSTTGLEQTFNMKDGKSLEVGRSSVLNIPLLANKMKEPERQTLDFAWSYKHGAVLKESYDLAEAQELEVSGVDDITVLKDKNGISFSPNTSMTLKTTAMDKKGGSYEATAVITSMSKKAVRLTGVKLPYAKGEDLTYKFSTKLYDDDCIEYTLHFNIAAGAMPEDKTINLDDILIDGRFSTTMYGAITPFTETMAADKDYYPEYSDADKKADLISEFFKQATNGTNTLTAKLNGTVVSGPDFEFGYDATNSKETSLVSIPAGVAEYDDELTFTNKVTVFGVTYTYSVAATIKPLGFSIERNSMWVNADNTVDLRGSVTFPTFKEQVGTSESEDYELPLIDVRDYVLVNGETAQDIENHELSLRYKVTTVKKDENGNIIKSGDDFASLEHETTLTTADYNDETNVLTWNLADEDARYRNNLSLKVELFVTEAPEISYGSVELTILVPELVSFKTIAPDPDKKKGAYAIYQNNAWTSANVVSALQVFDAVTSAPLYNSYATEISEFWYGNEYDKGTKTYSTTGDDVYRVYGQTELEIDMDNVTAIFETSGAEVPGQFINVDPETGDVSLAANTANITDNIIVKVPVSFRHNFCEKEHKQTAEIKFMKR